jgi:carbonic anhydrase
MRCNLIRVFQIALVISLFAPSGFAQTTSGQQPPQWAYSGDAGPTHWGALDTGFSTCTTGTQQSPVDLREVRLAQLAPVKVDWERFTPTVVNNGHTIQVNTDGKGSMVLDGTAYTLLQFHFHHYSEHTINGRHYPLEAHFVHRAEDGTLGVLAVFFREGQANPALQKIWDMAPLQVGERTGHKKFKPNALLPRDRRYFRYEGSLTTPPCTQSVHWVVFSRPLELSKAQLEAFSRLYPDNYRPIQPTNRRFILHSQ